MPFKVVQTREDDALYITYCPDNWESGGKLYWPPSMVQAEKFKKKETSQPAPNWKVFACEVKREKLTLAQAKACAKEMSDISETEEEDARPKPAPRRHNYKENACFNTFNRIAEQCTKDKYKPQEVESSLTKVEEYVLQKDPILSAFIDTTETINDLPPLDDRTMFHIQETDITPQSNSISQPNYTEVVTPAAHDTESNLILVNTNISENDTVTKKVDVLFSAMVVVQENQATIQKELERISKMVVNLDTKFDEFLKRAESIQRSADIGIQPIDSKNSLIDFEEKLKNPVVETELYKKLLFVCGVGKGKGMDNCYNLVDILFKRQFLTSCSWSGGSRKENEPKLCFKAYEKTFNFFFSLIRESDPSFTKVECETFFKNVLRNSTRRNKAKGLRTSASRVRSKKGTKSDLTSDPTQSGSKEEDTNI